MITHSSPLEIPVPPVEKLSGLLLVDKPSGPTSYDMIRWLKRTVTDTKIGHTGTLDPLASGLLIILLGRATKGQAGFMMLDKTYRCLMKLGISTDTGDVLGRPLAQKEVPDLSEDTWKDIFIKWTGPQSQVPPMYSALKKDGTPLYKLARKGQTVDREARNIVIHELTLLSKPCLSEVEFEVRCSSGTYVRTLVEDLGQAMGTVATVQSLRRVKIGSIDVADAIPGDQLKAMNFEEIVRCIRPTKTP